MQQQQQQQHYPSMSGMLRGGMATTSTLMGPPPLPQHDDGIARTTSADLSLSRCLHIGNVPITMTEAELLDVLRAHGRVETIKLVTQKGRRFAFCNFVSVEDAMNAKASLGRSDMWRYNVSFAKRETLPLPPPSSTSTSTVNNTVVSMGGNMMTSSTSSGPGTGGVRPQPNPALVEHFLAQGYTIEEAAFYAGCYGAGDSGGPLQSQPPAKQRNLMPSRHLWIGGLVNATRADILDVFGQYRKVEHFKFIKGRRCAFVDFVRQCDAEVAFVRMQGYCLGGSYIDLGYGKPERASTAHTITSEDLGLDDSHVPPGLRKPHRVSAHDPLYDLLTKPQGPVKHPLELRGFRGHGGVAPQQSFHHQQPRPEHGYGARGGFEHAPSTGRFGGEGGFGAQPHTPTRTTMGGYFESGVPIHRSFSAPEPQSHSHLLFPQSIGGGFSDSGNGGMRGGVAPHRTGTLTTGFTGGFDDSGVFNHPFHHHTHTQYSHTDADLNEMLSGLSFGGGDVGVSGGSGRGMGGVSFVMTSLGLDSSVITTLPNPSSAGMSMSRDDVSSNNSSLQWGFRG